MGLSGRLGRRDRWVLRENTRLRQEYAAATVAWQRDDVEARRMHRAAVTFLGLHPHSVRWLELWPGESVFWAGAGARLVEAPYNVELDQPSYGFFSIYRDETPETAPVGALDDEGFVAITNQRVVFRGRRRHREWVIANVIGVAHQAADQVLIQVLDRRRVTGVRLARGTVHGFRFHLALAFAEHSGDRAGFAAHLDRMITGHQSIRPRPPEPVTRADAPPPVVAAAVALASALLVAATAVATVLGLPPPSDSAERPDADRGLISGLASEPGRGGEPLAQGRRTTGLGPNPATLCGAPPNPYGYGFCGGDLVRDPYRDICEYFECTETFWDGTGHLVRCRDGAFAMTGGSRDSCAGDGGEARPVRVRDQG